MWSYFKKKNKKEQVLPPPAKEAVYNWCLFIPKDLSISSGIFFSSLGPGIKDYKNGILYIAPQECMPKTKLSRLSPNIAGKIILEYYGIYDYKKT
jgi:hypothetical protein